MEQNEGKKKGRNNVHQPTFEFLAPPQGDLPPRCCARCRNALYVYDKRFGGMHLRCFDVRAREYFGVNHPKDYAPDCIYFVREDNPYKIPNIIPEF